MTGGEIKNDVRHKIIACFNRCAINNEKSTRSATKKVCDGRNGREGRERKLDRGEKRKRRRDGEKRDRREGKKDRTKQDPQGKKGRGN